MKPYQKHRPPVITEKGPEKLKVGIDGPPDEIFQRSGHRLDTNRTYIDSGGWMYVPDHAEYIDGKGTFVHYREYGQHQKPAFPQACVTPPQAVAAINPAKRILLNTMKLLASKEAWWIAGIMVLMRRKWRAKLITRMGELYNGTAELLLYQWYMKPGYYAPVTKEIQKFVTVLLTELGVKEEIATKTGEIIGCMFQYDWAYRWRLQDMMGEVNKEAFVNDFPTEAKRLTKILMERDPFPEGIRDKYESIAKVMGYLWMIPSLRNALKRALKSIEIENMVMDEAEIYHTILYGDYNVKGRTLEERLKLYETYHGTNQETWPARVKLA